MNPQDLDDMRTLLANVTIASERSQVLSPPQRQFDGTELVRAAVLRDQAEHEFAQRRWQNASKKFEDAARAILGISHPWRTRRFPQRMSLSESFNGLARCMIKENDVHKALAWLEEGDILFKNGYLSTRPFFDWLSYDAAVLEHFSLRVAVLTLSSSVLFSLGNSGAAAQRLWEASVFSSNMRSDLDPKGTVKSMIPKAKIDELTSLRHPDPRKVATFGMKQLDPYLQVRGSWKRLRVPKGPTARSGFACWVWNGHVYVAGGIKESSDKTEHIRNLYDVWTLDLTKLDGWKELPSYPKQSSGAALSGVHMTLHQDKAYFFAGRPKLDFFDLGTRSWGSIVTSFTGIDGKSGNGKWPYPSQKLEDCTMQMIDGHLYVFGGVHPNAVIGCNLLVVLDLESRKWTTLSGTVHPVADHSCPGPRKSSASWVNEEQDRLYILFGLADRQTAGFSGQSHGATNAYTYDDLWSWSIPERKWRREVIRGNPPCPRAEMAVTYNPALHKTVVFGGYGTSTPTYFSKQETLFRYSYFADTFLFDYQSSSWKQVLTRGFPTYRAEARLFYDSVTKKTFLFGGYTNSDFVPAREGFHSRHFGDLWELMIDEPGGGFVDVDDDEERRIAAAGPWKRCFSCGSAGKWSKCGGICGGRVFFCDPQCLKEGWKEHKRLHNCRKAT